MDDPSSLTFAGPSTRRDLVRHYRCCRCDLLSTTVGEIGNLQVGARVERRRLDQQSDEWLVTMLPLQSREDRELRQQRLTLDADNVADPLSIGT